MALLIANKKIINHVKKFYFESFLFSIIIILLGGTNCTSGTEKEQFNTAHALQSLGYDFSAPDKKFKLPYKLEEISGLTYLDNETIACVQDESGKVFLFNPENEQIEEEIKFSKNGDFEGVSFYKGQIVVVKSNGDLHQFQLSNVAESKIKSKVTETPFSIDNDIEGITFNAKGTGLLIACKGKAEIDGNDIKGKAIYAYDFKKTPMSFSPIITITKKELEKFVARNPKNFLKSKPATFNPSGIAINPITNNIYIVSAKSPSIIVYGKNGGAIKEYVQLNKKMFKQAEGICFAPNGDLYIASEGDGGRGYILLFKHQIN